LRKDRQIKHRRLRIEDVDKPSFGKGLDCRNISPPRPQIELCRKIDTLPAVAKGCRAEVEQVGGSYQLHRMEGDGRGKYGGADVDQAEGRVREERHRNAGGIQETRAAP